MTGHDTAGEMGVYSAKRTFPIDNAMQVTQQWYKHQWLQVDTIDQCSWHAAHSLWHAVITRQLMITFKQHASGSSVHADNVQVLTWWVATSQFPSNCPPFPDSSSYVHGPWTALLIQAQIYHFWLTWYVYALFQSIPKWITIHCQHSTSF